MEYFIRTRSGWQGPFGPAALQRLVAIGKLPPGFSVICEGSGHPVPVEKAIEEGLLEAAADQAVADLAFPDNAGDGAPAGIESAPPRPARGGPVKKSALRPSLGRPPASGRGHVAPAQHPPAARAPSAHGKAPGRPGLAPRPGIHRPLEAGAPRRSPLPLIAIGASAILLVVLFLAVDRGARGAEAVGMAIGGAFFCMFVGAVLAALITAVIGWKGNRFAWALAGTSLFCGLFSLGVTGSRKGDGASEAASQPSGPIAFRADLYEITPAPGWTRSKFAPVAAADVAIVHSGSLSLFMVMVVEKKNVPEIKGLEEFALESREHFVSGTPGSRLTSAPEAVSGKGMPGIVCGISSEEKGLRTEGVHAVLSGGNAFFRIFVLGPSPGFAARRGEVDAMIASIRER